MNRNVSFLDGILAMKNNCPVNGNVSASFVIHNGSIGSVKLSKTEELFTEDEFSEEVFTDEIGNRILTDLENIRMQFGTITVSIDVAHGALKSYSLTPCTTLNANLLKAQIKCQTNRQLAKQHQAA